MDGSKRIGLTFSHTIMKKSIRIFSIILVAGFVLSTSAQCGSKTNNVTTHEKVSQVISKNVDVNDFESKINSLENVQLIDVRTPQEWNSGVIDGAMKININGSDFKGNVEKLDKKAPVLVYCRSGGRSGKAMKILIDLGFEEVYNLKGGITACNANGNKTVK